MSLSKVCKISLALVVGLAATGSIQGQTFTSRHSFAGTSGSDGAFPGYGALVQGFDGNLYGTTTQGGISCSFFGAAGCGEVFRITPAGSTTGVYEFCPAAGCADGNRPEGGLALNTNGNLYGMTDLGGSMGAGTVFKVTPADAFTSLDSFAGITNGAFPLTTLIRASNGSFYGVTNSGGASGEGALIRVTAAGALVLLQSFSSATTGIAQGDTGALLQGTDGNFYGVNNTGGSGGQGTVFKVTPGGKVTVLHSFSGSPDGSQPAGTLAQGTDGNFYGTTRAGGTNNNNGTVYKVTPAGKLTILYNFCPVNGCPDGFDPIGGLVLGTDGNFYGTTLGGGSGGAPGTVFRITAGGALTTLHSFRGIDGSEPLAGLVQHTDGAFYGTTNSGGTNGTGTVFSISVGLSPFAELVTTGGKVGAAVIVLGDALTGTSDVSFGGALASFKVNSDTEITATVPSGATTDFVKLTTPSGTLTSNKKFLILPQIKTFVPGSGPVGTVVTITGISLKQTISVKFGSKSATFTVKSDTEITAMVPTGASTGKITLTTQGGKVTSVTSFTVT